MAYDTRRGNPFKKYHPADFKIQSLNRAARDADVVDCQDNKIVVRPNSDNFRLEVAGFDTNRDLVVRVRTLNATAVGEA